MRIALLQLDAKLGQVDENIRSANKILADLHADTIDLLVLPELAFTGYNFVNLAAITSYLEPTTEGVTTKWAIDTAQRLQCFVIVGYPERSSDVDDHGNQINYNSTVTIDPIGKVVATYRKSHLYYIDESWASEGSSFYHGTLGALGTIAHGICMDINPKEFTAPWEAYEFANHCLTQEARTVVLSTAWLTHTSIDELKQDPDTPDQRTLAYWLERFSPLLKQNEETIVVIANRCGSEINIPRVTTAKNGSEIPLLDPFANYAGSSCVMRFAGGEVSLFDMLGQYNEGLLMVDTAKNPKYVVRLRPQTS